MIPITLPSGRRLRIADRTPAAVVMAALTAAQHMDIDDIREISKWSYDIGEDYFNSAIPNRSLSIIGVLSLYIACGVLGFYFPDTLKSEADIAFMNEVRRMAPAVICEAPC